FSRDWSSDVCSSDLRNGCGILESARRRSGSGGGLPLCRPCGGRREESPADQATRKCPQKIGPEQEQGGLPEQSCHLWSPLRRGSPSRSLRRPSDSRLGSRTPSPRTVRWRTPAARTRSALLAGRPWLLAPFVRFSLILDIDFYSPVQGAALWCVVGRDWAGCAIPHRLAPFDGN